MGSVWLYKQMLYIISYLFLLMHHNINTFDVNVTTCNISILGCRTQWKHILSFLQIVKSHCLYTNQRKWQLYKIFVFSKIKTRLKMHYTFEIAAYPQRNNEGNYELHFGSVLVAHSFMNINHDHFILHGSLEINQMKVIFCQILSRTKSLHQNPVMLLLVLYGFGVSLWRHFTGTFIVSNECNY